MITVTKALVEKWKNKIFMVSSPDEFNAMALEIFHFQYQNSTIYKRFIELLGISISNISNCEEIPFMPVSFFKNHKIKSGTYKAEMIFESSGTTSSTTSAHFIADLGIYRESFMITFQRFFGEITQYCVVGLLPSYLEKEGSSLVYMIDHLIKKSQNADSGFYLYDHESLKSLLESNKLKNQKTILFGVTFALLDFAEKFSLDYPELIIIETGGMKGRRKEMIREDLHNILKPAFGVSMIYSEYGMTELMSQAYSTVERLFKCPPWMKIFIGDIHNPQQMLACEKTGNINIIDLANVFSCSFLSTQDLGIKHPDNTFEVLGRIDYSDIRGCSLLV